MPFLIILVVGLAILAMFFLMNRKSVEQEREGVVKDVLKKDALVVEFEDRKPTVVKLFGITLAADNEMLDDKIFAFYDQSVRGRTVKVKPRSVGAGAVCTAELHTMAGEYINAALVRHGFARWSPTEAANDAELAEAQELARSEQLGIWNPAIRQLVEEKRRKLAAEELSDDDIANMTVDPDEQRTKESQ